MRSLPMNFDPKKYLNPQLDIVEIEEMKEAFDLIDSDNSETIDINELKSALRAIGRTGKTDMLI